LAVTLHWVIFLAIIALFTIAQIAESLPRAERGPWMDWHKAGGLCVLSLVVLRLLWRAVRGAPPLIKTTPVLDFIAKSTHHLLYLLLIAMPLTGFAMTVSAGRGVALLGIPPLMAKSESLAEGFEAAHGAIFIAVLVLVALHAAAALWHQYVRHDSTLGRMVPWLRTKA
jgi:cytochrome b561